MTKVVVHADDVAFCQGANDAFVELSASKGISAGAAMVPCPWFHDLAQRLEGVDPDAVDLGIHLTLTSEHPGYRWSPITRPAPSAGLTDGDGYMWPRVSDVRAHAHPDAVEAEWRAQIDRALSAGVDVTHLDAHMGAALAPEWCERYVALAVEYRVPALITARLDAYGPSNHLADVSEAAFAEFVGQARAAAMPVFDEVLETDFGRAADESVDYERMLLGADGELVYCAFHPCRPGPGEVERIDPDTFHVRTDEYDLFGRESWVSWLDDQSFDVVGMRELRDAWRTKLTQ